MGFTYQKLKRVKKNSTVLEKQENLEIQQNCTGFSQKKSTLIRERFFREPQNSFKSSEHKKDKSKRESSKQRVDLSKVLKQLEKDLQEKFEEKVQDTSCQLANLEQDINHDIDILQGGTILLLDQTNEMEKKLNRKEKYQNKQQEKTWAEYLAHNSCKERKQEQIEIAKERFSLQHQCISTSPRYGDDENLAPRPRMRSVGSQMTAKIEYLDQGAGDHKSVSNLETEKKFKGKEMSMKCLQKDPTNCCCNTQQQRKCLCSVHTKVVKGAVCYPQNYQQACVDANGQYIYCQDEYFYNCPKCGENSHYPCRCIDAATTLNTNRRRSTDLNTDYFYCPTNDRSCSSTSNSDKKSKRKTEEIRKSPEANVEPKERKRKESVKHNEKTNHQQRSKSKGANEKKSTKGERLCKVLSEEEVIKILRHFDRYVDDREKELKLKAKQILGNSSTSTSPSTDTKVNSETKLCQVTLVKDRSHMPKDLKGSYDESSLGSHYSLKTLHMLKKMKIREYKPVKPKENMKKNEEKSDSLDETKRQEKLKKYQEYLEKYSKACKAKEPVKVLKEPAKSFGERTSHEIDLFKQQAQKSKQRYPIQATSEEQEIRVQNLQTPKKADYRAGRHDQEINRNSENSANKEFQEFTKTLNESPSCVELPCNEREVANRDADNWRNDDGNYTQQYNNEKYYQDSRQVARDKARTSRSIDYNDSDDVTLEKYKEQRPRYYTDKVRDSLAYSQQPTKLLSSYNTDQQVRDSLQQPNNYADLNRDSIQKPRDDISSNKESRQRKSISNEYGRENDGNGHMVKRYEQEKSQQPIKAGPCHIVEVCRDEIYMYEQFRQRKSSCSEPERDNDRRRYEQEKSQQPIKTGHNDYVDQVRDSIQKPRDEMYSYEKSRQRKSSCSESGRDNDRSGHMVRRYEQEKSQQPIKAGPSAYVDQVRDSIQKPRDEIHSYKESRQRKSNSSNSERDNDGNGHVVRRREHEENQQPILTGRTDYVDEVRDSIRQPDEEIHSNEKSSQRKSSCSESGRENDGNGHMVRQREHEEYQQPIETTTPKDYVDLVRDSTQQPNDELHLFKESRQRKANGSEAERENNTNGHMVEGREHENDGIYHTNNGDYHNHIYIDTNANKRKSLDKEIKEQQNLKENNNVLARELEKEPLQKREEDKKANSKRSSFQKQTQTINGTQQEKIISPEMSDPSKTDNIEPSEDHFSEKNHEMEKKSRTSSSYKDFKQVMDLSLGIYNDRSSQTENNERYSQQTFDVEKEPDDMPATTEDALKYLKNFLSLYQQQSGMQQKCLYSVTKAANNLIQKLSSCKDLIPNQAWTSQENFKESRNSVEDILANTLEEKLTQVIQYDDPPDSSYSQFEQQLNEQVNEIGVKKDKDNFFSAQSYDHEVESPVAMEKLVPQDFNKELETNEYFEEELYQLQSRADLDYWQKLEDYHRYQECKESLISLAPPEEFSDRRPSSQYDIRYDPDYCDERYTDSQYYYSELTSSSRQPVFDPDLMPAKGILKPCRAVGNSQEAFCDLETYRTTSVVSFAQKELNVQDSSTMTCNQELERIEHFNKEMGTVTTRDKYLSCLEEQSTLKLTETTLIHPIYQDCQLETESVPENYTNNTCKTLCTKELPGFKQCPCMWETYVKLMQDY